MAFIIKKTQGSQHLCEVNTMYLVNFKLLKSLELTIDYLEVVKLKKKIHLGATKWCNNKYFKCFFSLDDSTNIC